MGAPKSTGTVNDYLAGLAKGYPLTTIGQAHGVSANAVFMALRRAGLPSSLKSYAEWAEHADEAPPPFVGPIAPKPGKRRGPKPRLLTLPIIHGRCEPFGDCLLWKGSVSGGRNGNGGPSARHNNEVTNLRRLVWGLANPTKELLRKALVIPTCREQRCLCEGHLQAMSMRSLAKVLQASGAYSNPAANARRIAASRAAAPKLSMEIAREIRAANTIAKVEAEKWGISLKMVRHIRQGNCWAESPKSMPANSVFALAAA